MGNNATINYEARRRLKSGVVSGDPVEIEVTLTQWDRDVRSDSRRQRSLSGKVKTVLMNFSDQWSVSLVIEPGGDVGQDDMDQFLYSTIGGEPFQITDLDNSDDQVTVRRVGRHSRSRRDPGDIGVFEYSFRVEEVI